MTEATRLSDFIATLHEFFSNFEKKGVRLKPEMCRYFRDACEEIYETAFTLEMIAESCVADMAAQVGSETDNREAYLYSRAVQHQHRRQIVRTKSVPLDDVVIALPNELREGVLS